MKSLRSFGAAPRAARRAVALSLAACGGAGRITAPARAPSRGRRRREGEITLDHGDIPGVMDAMKMDFAVADPTLLDGLAARRSTSASRSMGG